ncbi:MAG TPA: DUF2225 domain-containing protein [Planctomycetota bacterium]|nr:DUF2225 domain-containing protein [Planctomycetota bacterium]
MIALILGALWGAGPLPFPGSDERKEVDVVCPVDQTKFKAFEVVATNPWGGRDYDNCPHALKTTPLEYWVWVCPGCHFAGKKKDYGEKLTDPERSALQSELRPALPIPKGARQTDIPGHVKFDLLAQVARIRKLPPEHSGVAWLGASWSCRQQGAVDFPDFDEWDQFKTAFGLARTPLDLGKKNRTDYELEVARKVEHEVEAKKYERGPQRILSRYLAAFLYRKHGEAAEAQKWLSELDRLKGENSIVDEAALRMRASIEMERGYQKKAIDAYVAAIDQKTLDRRSQGSVAYLLGELFRRLGERDSARSWYQTALEGADSDEFRKLVTDQKAKLDR